MLKLKSRKSTDCVLDH